MRSQFVSAPAAVMATRKANSSSTAGYETAVIAALPSSDNSSTPVTLPEYALTAAAPSSARDAAMASRRRGGARRTGRGAFGVWLDLARARAART